MQFRKFRRLRGGCFRMGGAIFHFSQKIGLKSTKSMRFCILHKPMGGLEPPPAPPGYATVYRYEKYFTCKMLLFNRFFTINYQRCTALPAYKAASSWLTKTNDKFVRSRFYILRKGPNLIVEIYYYL